MRKIAPLLLFLSLFGPLAPAMARSDSASDRAAILAGVRSIVAPGAIPGDFVVFGRRAFTVATGHQGKAALPTLVAAEYGRGRVFAAGHEGFFGGGALHHPDNARLAANVVNWVGTRTGTRVGLIDQDHALAETLAQAGFRVSERKSVDLPDALQTLDLVWLNQSSLDGVPNRARVEAVRRWVQHGGGLVITGPAWGWQETHPALDLARDQSGNRLLLPMGIAFAAGMLDETGEKGLAVGTDEVPLSEANRALTALEEGASGRRVLSAGDLAQVTSTLGEAVGALPPGQTQFMRRVEAACANRGGDLVPTRQAPITTAMPYARLKAVLAFQRDRRLPPERVVANPAAVSFPGSVPVEAPREARTLAVDTAIPDWHGTGLYAAPGEVVTVTLPTSAVGLGLSVRIGAHTDTLWSLSRWERFPEISLSRPLDRATVHVASPFGGAIYIEVPERAVARSIPITVTHAVAAPRFVRGLTSEEEWKRTIRNAPGPWAELEGHLVILTVPSSAVRDLDDPEALMAYWDEVMENCYALYAAPKRPRPERYCVDRQISAGYMHSGYPIMTGDDVAKTFCDVKTLRGGAGVRVWGFYHEMGHNFQQPEWTWDEFGEVTNNLFSLYGNERLNGVRVGAHPAMTAVKIAERERLVAGAPGKERYYARDPWYPLTMFWLLRREFGWEPFTHLFAEFRDLSVAARPRSEAEKHDQFLVRFSKATGHNLADYLAAWGVETSTAARAEVASLPPWMPSDWPR